GRSKMSDVECAGSGDTSSTRRPRRLAASAAAAAHVVLPTPPLPPKSRMRRCSRWRTSTAGKRSERRMLDPHAPVPLMEFVEQQRIHVEQVEGRRVRHAHQLEIAEKHEEIVERERLLAQLVLKAAKSRAVQHVAERAAEVG